MFESRENRLAATTVHTLDYRPIFTHGLAREAEAAEVSTGPAAAEAEKLEERIRELERELAEEKRGYELQVAAARQQAREEGRAIERDEQTTQMQTAAEALTTAIGNFLAERDDYLAKVEHEVVRLALAIAARVLHREALMDPLLLAGAVRVALGQLADTTEVRLMVPAAEHAMWSEMLRLMPNLPLRPTVLADEALTTGDCFLETDLGSVDLGVRSQLAEIERGFFDLLEQRNRRPAEGEARAAGTPQAVETRAALKGSARGDIAAQEVQVAS